MAKKKLDIPPGILTAVERSVAAAVGRQLHGMSLVDLKKCQEELVAAREAVLDMQQNFLVWQELAKMRGDENMRLQEQIGQLNEELVQLRTELVQLRADLGGAAHG